METSCVLEEQRIVCFIRCYRVRYCLEDCWFWFLQWHLFWSANRQKIWSSQLIHWIWKSRSRMWHMKNYVRFLEGWISRINRSPNRWKNWKRQKQCAENFRQMFRMSSRHHLCQSPDMQNLWWMGWFLMKRCRNFRAGFIMKQVVWVRWSQISFSFPDWMKKTVTFRLNW